MHITISSQEDAALVAAMARQALEDAELLQGMANAGCTRQEARALFGVCATEVLQ